MSDFSEAQKQFILGALTYQSHELRDEMKQMGVELHSEFGQLRSEGGAEFKQIREDIAGVDDKIDILSESIADAIFTLNEANELRFKKCETTLAKLRLPK